MPITQQLANAFIASLLSGSEREAARTLLKGLGVVSRVGRSALKSAPADRSSQSSGSGSPRPPRLLKQRRSPSEDYPDISDLKQLFDDAGIDIKAFAPTPGVGTIERQPLEPLGGSGRGGRGGRGGGRGGRGVGGLGEPPSGPSGRSFPSPSPGPDPDDKLPPWIEDDVITPNSTNVYSFAFRPDSSKRRGSLFVTFRGHKVNSDSVRSSRGSSGKGQGRQLRGKLGSTVSGERTNFPGAVYEYLDVPVSVVIKLHAVKDQGDQEGPGVKSPGTFVWSELRERGTIHGHKYTYRLVQGALIDQDGTHGIYVPRKATAKGFRIRSEAAVDSSGRGVGRRGSVRSTLPEQFFTTRRKR